MAAAESQSLDAIALAHDLRGCLLLRNGDVADSLPEFDQAIALVGSVAESEQPSLFLNRGSAHLYRRDLPAARDDLTTSATLAGRIGLTRLESKAMHNLGYAEYLAGNLPLALDTLARAHELDQDVARAGLLDRARVLIEAGLLDEAEEALAEASTGLRRQRANQDRAEADLARAEVALLQGNSTLARTHSGRARRDFRRRQSAGWQARADVTRWQAYLGAKGGPARVAREIRSAEAGRTSPSFDREVAIIAAEAQLALGHVDDAVVLLQTVQGRSATDSLTGRLHQHLVRAGVARAAGDPAAAQRELRVGLRTLAEQQARHHSLDLRTAMAVHGGRLAELDLRVALESSSPRMVFDSLERWRAMSHRRTAVTPPRDPELAALVSRLRIVAEDLRSAPPGARTELLQRQRRTVERQVREREWRLQGEGRSERSTTLAQLRPALTARGTEVVAYFVLDHRLGAVTVGRGRPRVHTLGSWAEVSALMTRVRADLDALAGRMLPAPLRVAVSSLTRRTTSTSWTGCCCRTRSPPPAHCSSSRPEPSRRRPGPCCPGGWDGRRPSRSPPPAGCAGWASRSRDPASPRWPARAWRSPARGTGRRRDMAGRCGRRQRARQCRGPRHRSGLQRPRPHRGSRAAQPGQPAVLQHPDGRRPAVRLRRPAGRAGRRSHRPVRVRPGPTTPRAGGEVLGLTAALLSIGDERGQLGVTGR